MNLKCQPNIKILILYSYLESNLYSSSSQQFLQSNLSRYISFISYTIIKTTLFEGFILLTILFNTVMLILDDPTSTQTTPTQQAIELFFLITYTTEMSLKIIGLGFVFNKNAYLRDGWNILDFCIVVSSLLSEAGGSTVNLNSLRSLRVLRPLRTISSIRALKILLATLISAIPALINTIIILSFFFLIFAIGGVQLYKGLLKQRCFNQGIPHIDEIICGGEKDCPQDFFCGKSIENPNFGVTNFDTIFYSFLMVFQSVTMEGWTDIMYMIFDAFSIFTVLYFVVLVFVGSFFLLNLTLAVIKTKFTMQEQKTNNEVTNDDLIVDDYEQERLREEQKIEEEEKEESSSDEEQVPDLQIMKTMRQKMRQCKTLEQTEEKETYIQLNFEELMMLRSRMKKEEKEEEEKNKNQLLISQYIDNQQKTLHKMKCHNTSQIYPFDKGGNLPPFLPRQNELMRKSTRQTIQKYQLHNNYDAILQDLENMNPSISQQQNQQQSQSSLIELKRFKSKENQNVMKIDKLSDLESSMENIDNQGDLLNDSDFIDQQQIQGKELSLAQFIFTKNLAHIQQKKTQINFKKDDPKKYRFLMKGFKTIKHLANELDTQDEKIEYKDLTKKKEKFKGKLDDYKLVLNIHHDYFSSSTSDVMERKIHQKEKDKLQHLEQSIKNKQYEFVYPAFEEDLSLIKEMNEEQKSEELIKRSVTSTTDTTQVTASSDFKLKINSDIRRHQMPISVRNKEHIRKQTYDGYSLYNDKTYVKKVNNIKKKKYKKQPNESRIEYTYYTVARQIVEPIEDRIQPFTISNDRMYLFILQQDYHTEKKQALHWSGEDVFEQGLLPKRANKIRKHLQDQDYTIWIKGILGFLIVQHKELQFFVRGKLVENFLTLAVICNTVVLALDGLFTEQETLDLLQLFNEIFTWIFIFEMAIKLIAFSPIGYVRDKMNIFDGCIVILSILEMTMMSDAGSGQKAVSAFRAVRIFRTFRVLRVTRLLRSLAFMQIIISVISSTLENFIYISILMFLFIIIYALLGMQMYGGTFNFRNNKFRASFDNFQDAFLAVFQLLTMENWGDILILTFRAPLNKFLTSLYLISWIFIGNFVFLNLFLAILIDGFCSALDDDQFNIEIYVDEDNKYFQLIEKKILEQHQDMEQQKQQIDYLIEKQALQEEENDQSNNRKTNVNSTFMEDEIDMDFNKDKKNKIKQLFEGIECEDSLYIFSKKNTVRIYLYRIVVHPHFENIILAFIVVSSLKLAVDTYFQKDSPEMNVSEQIDIFFNFIFALEALMKIIAFGFFLDQNSYLRESWSQLDFFIVISSLIDMAFESVELPVIKILRLLRTLRPLRFISHNVAMKTVVIALLESFGGMINVIIVVALIWLMFAILGISLIGGRMGYCDTQNYYGINYEECQDRGLQWKIYKTNFDNIYYAMNTLYIVSSLEGWPDIMYPTLDGDYKEYGPSKNNFKLIAWYYVAFILVGSFFLINLFVGVICFYFEQASKNERRKGNIILTPEQENWIEIQGLILKVNADFTQYKRPKSYIRGKVFDLVSLGYFDAFIMLCIVLNILTMAMAYEGSSKQYNEILEGINYFFTSVFILETILKIIAYNPQGFWKSGWNQFDLFVVLSSIVDIILSILMGGDSVSFLRVGPQLMRIVRVLRVTRLLKLVKSMRGLQKLISTLLYSLPSLINIGALLFLVFFIYAVLGVFLFKSVTKGEAVTRYNNFSNFGYALITLFRCSTGENWHVIMFDMMSASSFSSLYFLSFVMICSFIMLNLFILIIIQYFENYNLKEDNPLDVFQENLEIFKEYWYKFTKNSDGLRMEQKHLVQFFQQLPEPLGFDRSITKQHIAKEVMAMQLIGDGGGNLYLNEVLFASMKKVFWKKILEEASLNLELQQYLIGCEQQTKKKIEKKKMSQIRHEKRSYNVQTGNSVNPLLTFLNNRMCFLALMNYAVAKIQKGLQTPCNELDDDDIKYYSEFNGVQEQLAQTTLAKRMIDYKQRKPDLEIEYEDEDEEEQESIPLESELDDQKQDDKLSNDSKEI